MIIYNTNIVTAPLLPVIWIIDCYLFLAVIRLFLGRCQPAQANKAGVALQTVTDPIPRAIRRWLSTWRDKPVPAWLPWAIVIAAAIIIRQLLLMVILSTQ